MRGRLQAILVIAGAAVLPMLLWLSGAAAALVTLRRGLIEGLLVCAVALAGTALLFGLMTGVPQLAVKSALEVWLPVLLLSAWLRYTVSLASTVRAAAVMSALVVVGMHLSIPDQAAYWGPILESVAQSFAGGTPETEQAWRQLVDRALPVMTGIWVFSLLALVMASLLLGRWLQALLYNPGGFGGEFRELDLGRAAALVVVALLVAATMMRSDLLGDLVLVCSSVFALQALSVMHALVAKRGLGSAWLAGIYVLLPFAFQLVVIAGIADAIFKWRQRLLEQMGRDGSA